MVDRVTCEFCGASNEISRTNCSQCGGVLPVPEKSAKTTDAVYIAPVKTQEKRAPDQKQVGGVSNMGTKGLGCLSTLVSWFIAYAMTGAVGWYEDIVMYSVFDWMGNFPLGLGWPFPLDFISSVIQIILSFVLIVLMFAPYLVWLFLASWPLLMFAGWSISD